MKKPYSRAQYKRKGNSSKAAKLMFGYVWQNKDLFYLYWPVVLGMEVLAILARVMFSQILDKLEAGSHDTLALLLVAVIMTDLIHLGFDIMYVKVVVRNFEYTLLHRLTMQVMRHISALGAEFYSSVPAALIKDRVNKIYLVSSLISQASWSVFTHLLQIVVSLVLILIYLPNTLGLWLVAVVTYSILVFLRMNQLMYRAQTPSRRRRKDIEESGVSENRDRLIDANATLVTNAALGSTLSRLDRDYTHLLKVGMIDLSFLFYGAGLQRDLVLMYGRRGCLATSVLYAVNGWISVAELVLINTLVETMFIGMWGVSRFLYSFIHDSESILKLDELMKLQPTVKCPDDPKAVPVGPLGFQLQNVGFTYPDLSLTLDEEETQIMSASNKRESENGHLQNIGLVIEAGQRVALVGPSGAGKTTLAGLLGCTRYPTEGSVLVNGIDITHVDPQKIWDRIAFVPQGTAIDLFNDTLLYNITLGRRYSEATVIEVLKLVDLWDTVVSQWPLGIQEKIGERGRTLSGGQQQRVAIARALIRNPDLLILDEATSSLDVQTERIVQKSVEELPADTTVVIIAHRLSTIRNVDVIAVLQDGKIVDSGSWEDLVDRCELFEEMVALQNLG